MRPTYEVTWLSGRRFGIAAFRRRKWFADNADIIIIIIIIIIMKYRKNQNQSTRNWTMNASTFAGVKYILIIV